MTGARARVAQVAYAFLLGLLAPAYVLRLWWRGRAEPLYRVAIGERFGRYPVVACSGWVWVHAVSLGETRAAAALIDALRALRPDQRLLLTHGTATGREAGKALLREGDVQVWLPYDVPPVARRFLGHFRPAIGVLMETEVWPNLVCAARAKGIPMVLANARLSARSERRGRQLAALLGPAVESLALVMAQSDADARRLRAVGARHVVVSGNLKFDMTPDAGQLARGRAWRQAAGRAVVLAAVTREGEEETLFAAWAAQPGPRPLLLVVPRHPQRFDEVAALVRAARFTLARRSGWVEAPPGDAGSVDVWLGDSMGEMALYYGLADVALLGGSFAPLGGQNLIEAAACGCPVVMGPHTFNFTQAAELALAAGAAVRVADLDAAVREALGLLVSARKDRMARAALDFAAQHRGAAARMAEQIVALLEPPGAASAAAALRPTARST
jgi:3-deoxy-D-manno-octulosonic-acid transferase